jgi:uncharacterized protein (DUF486 family)
MLTIILLILANVFMTFAWYGHLKNREMLLWHAILLSWGIAFFEYCLQVPANRIGARTFTLPQLKIMQEVITLAVFLVFVKLYFQQETFRWNDYAGMGLILLASILVFQPSN